MNEGRLSVEFRNRTKHFASATIRSMSACRVMRRRGSGLILRWPFSVHQKDRCPLEFVSKMGGVEEGRMS